MKVRWMIDRLSGARGRKVFPVEYIVMCSSEHCQEAVEKGRLGQLPADFGRQGLFLARAAQQQHGQPEKRRIWSLDMRSTWGC